MTRQKIHLIPGFKRNGGAKFKLLAIGTGVSHRPVPIFAKTEIHQPGNRIDNSINQPIVFAVDTLRNAAAASRLFGWKRLAIVIGGGATWR